MNPLIAVTIFALGILGLFALNRDQEARTSRALWIPVAWLLIAGSRNVAEWLQLRGPIEASDAYQEGSPLDRNILLALIALALIVLFQRRRQVQKLLRANLPLVLYFLYCGVSILWSGYPDVSFKRWIRALGDVVMVLVVLTDLDKVAALKRFLARAGFLLIPLSILLIRYYSDLGRQYSAFDGSVSWTGVTTSKNALGMICLVFGLASAWRLLEAWRSGGRTRRRGMLIAHATIVTMALWLIWKANSATSLACLILAGGVMLLASRPTLARRLAVVHFLIVVVISVSVVALFFDPGAGLLQALGRDSTLTGRTEIWRLALSMAASPIVGTGYESFWIGPRLQTMWGIYHSSVNQAHNGYLEVYLNLGWLGVALLATILIAGYGNVIGAVRRQAEAAPLMLAYFVVGVTYNLTEAAFKMMSPVWIVFLLAITAVPEARAAEAPVADDRTEAIADWDPEPDDVAPVGLSQEEEA